MAEVVKVESRESKGSRDMRRLRAKGSIPAVLYGHGEKSVSLQLSSDVFAAAMRHGSRVVELQGAVNEKALIRDVQWDTFGVDVLHVDFARVSEHERVHVEVKLELKGQAAGQKDGGVVEFLVHELEVECEALSIPEKIVVSVGDLKLNGSISAGQVVLPPGMTLLSDPEAMVVHCVKPMDADAVTGGETIAEPELIGRKAAEEGAEEEK
jgi:large subunit ribosomal protein L25